MRHTQFQLTQIKHQDKTIEFQNISQQTKKNVLRLLDQARFSSQIQQQEAKYFFIYIDPLSDFTFIWNILFIIVFYLVQLQISLSLAFGPHFFQQQLAFNSFYLPFYITTIIFLAVDMFLNFFKGYYAFGRGKVIDEFNKIIKNYLVNQIYYDILVIFFYLIPLIKQSYGINYLQLIPGIFIWVKKYKYQTQIINYLQYQAGARAGFMLLILFLDVLLIGHYGACIFIGMDLLLWKYQYYGDNTAYYWLSNNTSYPNDLMNGPWYFQYIYGQQFSTGTLSTLAPGPFAKNPWQAFYAIIVMIFFMVLASYVGQVLIQIVYTYTQRRVFHEQNIMSFDNFMQLKAVTKQIRQRIYNFFELVWQVQLKLQSKQQEAMIQKLPTYLKQQLLLQIGFTKHIYFLRYLPYEQVVQKLISLKIQRVTVDSNTCIFQSQKTFNIGQRNIYFIKQGMAKFYLSQNKSNLRSEADLDIQKRVKQQKILNLSNSQKLVGVYQFLTGQDYKVCCKSIDLSLVQKLSFSNFIEIVNEMNIHQQYEWLKYRILIQRDIKLINKVCVVCLQNHMQSDCPHLYPSVKIRKQFNDLNKYTTNNSRKFKKRKNLKSNKFSSSIQQLKSKKQLSLFQLFPNINIGQLIIDINKMANEKQNEIDEVYNFTTFYKQLNADQQ